MTAAVREIGVALLGLGNVGAGVVKLLEDNAAAIGARLGGRLVVRAIAVRAPGKKKRLVEVDPALLTNDIAGAIARPDVDIVCELIGGDGEAKDAVMAAIAAGKHVVTANKLLLARQGHRVTIYERVAEPAARMPPASAGCAQLSKLSTAATARRAACASARRQSAR